MKYRTKDGDVLDAICREYYGKDGMLEAVYEANTGLADQGPVLAGCAGGCTRDPNRAAVGLRP